MVVLCCIVVVTGFLPFLVSRSSLSSPPSQVYIYFRGLVCNFLSEVYQVNLTIRPQALVMMCFFPPG